jgi:hypothetical protein
MMRQSLDQPSGNLAGFRQGPACAGKLRNQVSQLFDRVVLIQRRQPLGLVPRIEAEPRERGDHGQRNSVALRSNRGK